jgi:hypothetical protein
MYITCTYVYIQVVAMEVSARSSTIVTKNGAKGLPKDWKGDLLNVLQKKHKGYIIYIYICICKTLFIVSCTIF